MLFCACIGNVDILCKSHETAVPDDKIPDFKIVRLCSAGRCPFWCQGFEKAYVPFPVVFGNGSRIDGAKSNLTAGMALHMSN